MFKDFFKKAENGNDKKRQIENIVVFIIILIITVLIINSMWSSNKKDSKEENNNTSKVLAQTTSNVTTAQEDLEKKLEDILESINGVGKVKTLIKYSESSTVVAMYNENSKTSVTEETDTSGGTRKMEIIEGAIITAQGASNANVKSSIVSAVEAVTGLAVHKIQVFEMGGK